MKLFISIINYNASEYTRACLRSLEKTNLKGCTLFVVIIDNGSLEPFSVDKKQCNNIDFVIIRKEENMGFTGGQNIGIKYALQHGADAVVILNNDVELDKNVFSELVVASKEEKNAGIIVPKIYFAKGSEYHKERYKKEDLGNVIWYAGGEMDWANVIGYHKGVDEVDYGQYDTRTTTEIATGCCMLIKREVFEKVGFFDERYFLYYEDSDLSIRVKKAGFSIFFTPKAFLWHKNAASAGGSGSVLHDYYITRNRLLFGMQYASMRTKIALVQEGLRLLLVGREWQKKAVKDYFLRRFGKGTYQ